jgi:hypothetical protein
LTITTFLVFQGITPSIWGSIADVYGRSLVLVPRSLPSISIYLPSSPTG